MSDEPRKPWEPPLGRAYEPPRPKIEPTRADVRRAEHFLETGKFRHEAWAVAIVAELDRLRADLARVPVGARSKHRTHRWTGRHWLPVGDQAT
jgi:hypothetical protein